MSHYFSYSYKLKCSREIFSVKKILFQPKKPHRICLARSFSIDRNQANDTKKEKFIPFFERINLRRSEARKSILVQVQSAQSFKELHSYCNAIGTVENMFHYSTGVEPMHFIIVEFEKEQDVKNILDTSNHIEENMAIPTHSNFLWFRASNRKLPKLKQSKHAKMHVKDATKILGEDQVAEILTKCDDISDQMKTLHDITKLNDVGTRLRFLTAKQIEDALTGIFPHAVAYPFGSSVNGYGKMGCDLDLILRLVDKKKNDESRLMFHCKPVTGTERSVTQRHMETVGDLIHLFLPGCGNVRRILQARVPIIKYHQQLTDVECDVSMSNMSGVHMSDFLYLMGELDERVRPLVFCIRRWANIVGITNSSPGRWITNFSLTLLVLAFLQKPMNSPPVLPTLNTLTKLADTKDQYELENGIVCSFLRDIQKYHSKNENTESLETLLREFFEFYTQFDFSNKAVCLNETVNIAKPEFSAMYIVNPLERGLNVSKNVSLEEVERFKSELKNAAWILESQESKSSNWGLLSIFEAKRMNINSFSLRPRTGRLVKVSDLFEMENEKSQTKPNLNAEKDLHNEKIIVKDSQR